MKTNRYAKIADRVVERLAADDGPRKFDGKLDNKEEYEISIKVKGDASTEMLEMLEYIGRIAGYGHSFAIVVDPDSSDYTSRFGMDGDGADRLFEVKLDGKLAKFKKEK